MELALFAAGFGVGFLVCAALGCYLIIRGHKASVLVHKQKAKNEA